MKYRTLKYFNERGTAMVKYDKSPDLISCDGTFIPYQLNKNEYEIDSSGYSPYIKEIRQAFKVTNIAKRIKDSKNG